MSMQAMLTFAAMNLKKMASLDLARSQNGLNNELGAVYPSLKRL
ncbi:hypothetical protein ACH0BF_21805 [Pseudobacillus sp. 179-B 2D1 NHS]